MDEMERFVPYTVDGVKVTERELGRGSYAAVMELDYKGKKCAGKKVYQVLNEQGARDGYALQRFAEECRLLSEIRHPNVVQFLGVSFQDTTGTSPPILVMEFLPLNLSSCIDEYGVLPERTSYSILLDVSLGLNFLHTQTPPIVHRDLSANNILLTSNMTAKIADLGVAKVLNLTPLQMSRMTSTPGTPTYMPPEVMVAEPKYSTSVDVFSFGVIMIHVFSGKWPHPQSEPVRVEASGRMIPVSEADRREKYLSSIGHDHPQMELILKCVSNHPQLRCLAADIVHQLKGALHLFPPLFANEVEMLSRIKAVEGEKKGLVAKSERKDEEIQLGLAQVKLRERIVEDLMKNVEDTAERLELAHSAEVEQLRSQVKDLNAQVEMIATEKQTIQSRSEVYKATIESERVLQKQAIETQEDAYRQLLAEISAKNLALCQKDNRIRVLDDQLMRTREYLSAKYQPMQCNIVWKQCSDLPIPAVYGQTSVVNNKVYYGGFDADRNEDEYKIYCYDPLQDMWDTLPPLPVRWFGLGQMKGLLVAVGGGRVSNNKVSVTNELQVFDQKTRTWKKTLPCMPTARRSVTVASHEAALVVAGGNAPDYVTTVEVLHAETLMWYRTDSLPTPCRDMSSAVVGDGCYLIGGYKLPSKLKQVLRASIDQLLHNGTPLIHSQPSDTVVSHRSVWNKLTDAPNHCPTATVLADAVLSIGGLDGPRYGTVQNAVYMYSYTTNSWMYVADLPAPEKKAVAAAVMSPTEILVIGGISEAGRKKTVYKGTLCIAI